MNAASLRLTEWTLWNNKLVGRVYGHPEYADGSMIVTAPLTQIDFVSQLAMTTSGQTYFFKDAQAATAVETESETTYAV